MCRVIVYYFIKNNIILSNNCLLFCYTPSPVGSGAALPPRLCESKDVKNFFDYNNGLLRLLR